MPIIRTSKDKNNPYTVINRFGINDKRLSYKARGILVYFLDKPDNWQVMTSNLINNSPDGKTAVYSGLKELEKYGYLIRRPIRDEKMRISAWEQVIYEYPQEPLPENRKVVKKPKAKLLPENQKEGLPEEGSAPLTNTDLLTSTEKQQQEGGPPASRPAEEEEQPQQEPVVVPTATPEEKEKAAAALVVAGVTPEAAAQLVDKYPPERISTVIEYGKVKAKDNLAGFVVAALKHAWTLPKVKSSLDTEREQTKAYLAELDAIEMNSEAPESGIFETLKNICRGKSLKPAGT